MKTARSNSGHTIAVFDADGKMHRVQADEIRMCAPTTKCVTFWVQCFSAVLVIALGTFFMIFQGASSTFFPVGSSLLSLGVGILIPSPKYENVIPRRISSHAPTDQSEDRATTEEEMRAHA